MKVWMNEMNRQNEKHGKMNEEEKDKKKSEWKKQ